ncbi:hypothetical protein C8R45DRAFT_1212352 [Mycena sanguinolenta]|nr:hypothetical protein C8R45DRAFT_1212352 [Mycena sanguinolenta]
MESGTTEDKSGKGSVLHRLASAVAGTLGRRKQSDNVPAISQIEKPDPQRDNYSNAENEEACAKIWSIYVEEAKRYDAALVESWKADMEGMLIFSGLFSASLTAFLIESYKALQADSGDLTAAGIALLSHQLAAIASNTTFVLPPPSSFTPTTGSLWCNALWFVSLSLSLTCALLATLVEQWAREFLHKTELRPSPLRRARVFSFLYFGLKHFGMHTIVDAIPFLLHASLLLFFAGLVTFLLPVNRVIMYLMCTVLVVFLVLYTVLTVLPVLRLDCPYRTPLSAPLWSMLQRPFGFLKTPNSSSQQTITEAVAALALQDTIHRDQRALQWTLESLTDDIELLPFVEAIPDIIFGPNGFRRANDALFEGLLGTIDVGSPLVSRISALVAGTAGMSPQDPLRARRRTAGQRAIWALCMMPCAWDRLFDIDETLFVMFPDDFTSTIMLAVRYQAQRWAHCLLGRLRDLLDESLSTDPRDEVLPTIQRLMRLLMVHQHLIISPFRAFGLELPSPCSVPFAELKVVYDQSLSPAAMPTVSELEKIRGIVATLCGSHDWAHNSLVFMGIFITRGLHDESHVQSDLRSELLRTCYSILAEIGSSPPRQMVTEYVITFPTIQNLEFSPSTPPLLDTFARIVCQMLPFFGYSDIQRYVGQRRNVAAIQYALADCNPWALAHNLATPLFQSMTPIVLELTIAASCLPFDSAAIAFVDAVFARGLPHLVHTYPALEAVRYLRRLRQVNNDLSMIEMDLRPFPRSTMLPHLQAMCHQELFGDISPLFLPEDVNMRTVVESLQIHLLNKYISFLTDLLQSSIPTTVKLNIPAFDRFLHRRFYRWENVDTEIQNSFFAALRAHTKTLATTESNLQSDMAAIARHIWDLDIFWANIIWQGREPDVEEIQPSCLELLRESLELYLAAPNPPAEDDHISVDLSGPRRLLAEVQEELSGTGVVPEENS